MFHTMRGERKWTDMLTKWNYNWRQRKSWQHYLAAVNMKERKPAEPGQTTVAWQAQTAYKRRVTGCNVVFFTGVCVVQGCAWHAWLCWWLFELFYPASNLYCGTPFSHSSCCHVCTITGAFTGAFKQCLKVLLFTLLIKCCLGIVQVEVWNKSSNFWRSEMIRKCWLKTSY